MNHGSLFSGIGGFDLAAQMMDWENIFHCEWNPFGQKILKHYWPKAISYNDITQTDFSIHRGKIDILTGGFPCQPYSVAGKRKGKEDERHLWPEMLRAIREIQPSWVVGENVFGLINWSGGLVFHEVQTDLEAAGYEVWPYVLPAAAVNAPHRRDRVWFIAHSNSRRGWRGKGAGENDLRRSEGEKQNYYSITTDKGLEQRNDAESASDTNGINRGRKHEYEQESGDVFGESTKDMVGERTLPTPTTQEISHPEAELTETGRRKAKNGNSHSLNIADLAILGLVPTPTARDYKGANSLEALEKRGRNPQTNSLSDNFAVSGKSSQLNPRFVLEMMGFPPTHTLFPFQKKETIWIEI